jgi:predicted secreted Zn-dependent protease
MKKLLALLVASAFIMPVMAAEEKKAEPEIKTVCVDVQGKDGKAVIDPKTKKPKQNCTKVKVRPKFEGTKIEDAKKK